MDDYNKTENMQLTSISIKSELDNTSKKKYKLKNNISNKHIQISALFFAVLITISLSIFIHTEISNVNSIFSHETILDEPELLHSLQTAQANGITIAIHGWEHENYSEITVEQAVADVKKSQIVFEQAGFKSGLFIAPFEIFGVPEKAEVMKAIQNTGLHFETKKEPIYEYTWIWRNVTSFGDPRFQAASSEIRKDNPKTILFHAQDWNKYTEQLLVSYLTSTNEKNITLRMDDVGVNTPKEVIDSVAKLNQYN
jgi:hypothetical protein